MRALKVFGWMSVAFIGFQCFIFAISDAFYSAKLERNNGVVNAFLIAIGIILIMNGIANAFESTDKE